LVAGGQLSDADDKTRSQLISNAKIFGRILPQQKQEIILELKKSGKYVAMIGDGVNDILSIKEAHIGIAMQHGSSAARAVADIILLDNSFSSLPLGFEEGQRIVSGLYGTIKIFLSRVLYMLMILACILLLGLPFVFTIKQSSLIALFTSGIPTFGLALWAKPQLLLKPQVLVSSLFTFAFPVALSTTFYALSLYIVLVFIQAQNTNFSTLFQNPNTILLAQNSVVFFIIFAGITLVALVYPCTKHLQFHPFTHLDWRPTALAFVLAIVTICIFFIPSLYTFWEVLPLSFLHIGVVSVAYFCWLLSLIILWKYNLVHRFLAV